MSNFVKLYGSILYSTVWLEPLPTKVVWITMLALADADGVVAASIPGLAQIAGVTREQCEAAIATLSAPDPDSKTPEHEGRRIEKAPTGWFILNHRKYRDLRTETQVRTAERVKAHRARTKAKDVTVTDVTGGTRRNGVKRGVRAEVEEDRETTKATTSPGGVTGNGSSNGQHHEPWPVEGAKIWRERVGPIDTPRFGKALKPVVDEHGWPVAREALATYIEANKGKARKVEWFRDDAVRWVRLGKMPVVDPETRELTEKGRLV